MDNSFSENEEEKYTQFELSKTEIVDLLKNAMRERGIKYYKDFDGTIKELKE